MKGFTDLCLKAKAIIWPLLSYVCHFCSDIVCFSCRDEALQDIATVPLKAPIQAASHFARSKGLLTQEFRSEGLGIRVYVGT